MGVNFAIPVSHLRQFLSRPEILFTPPVLKRANQHELVEFRAKAVSLLSPTEPLALQLTLGAEGKEPRHYDMRLIDGIHRVRAVPIPVRKGPLVLRVTTSYPDGAVSGSVQDRSFKIGEKQIKLSEVSRLRVGQETEAVLHDGERLRGGLSDLGVVPITFGGQSLRLKLDSATEVKVDSPGGMHSVMCTLVALQSGVEVGRLAHTIYTEESRRGLGLIAHYPFNGDARDTSGNRNDASVKGATLTTDRFGKPNRAYNFSGRAYIETPVVIDQSSSGPGATMTAWIYRTSARESYDFVISADDGGYDWAIKLLRDGHCHVFTGEQTRPTGFRAELNTWQFLAAVFIPGEGVVFYKNGRMATVNHIDYDASTGNVWIGANRYYGGQRYLFRGKIDDVRIYERPLEETEIRALYHGGGWPTTPRPGGSPGRLSDALAKKIRTRTGKGMAPTAPPPKTYTNPTDGSTMIYVPAGTFRMGGDGRGDCKPIHDVHVSAFFIGKYEITNKQFKIFVDANPQWRKGRVDRKLAWSDYLEHWKGHTYPSGKADHPVVYVSWFAAKAYCEWAGGRLPTEAEWEYACRAGSTTKYCFGDSGRQLGEYAWYRDNSNGSTHPVGQKKPNQWHIHDMHGNAWEWCSSKFQPYPYKASDGREELDGPGSHRVLRGGSWSNLADFCRSATRTRGGRPPSFCGGLLGFRVAVSSRAQRATSSPHRPRPRLKRQLPPGLETAFMLPDKTRDQHGNPVVRRKGRKSGRKTSLPDEVWLKEPRMEFVSIPAGPFVMGSPTSEAGRRIDEGPQHRVRITTPFYMGKYEVTKGQYCAFKSGLKSREVHETHSLPKGYVAWSFATPFCEWLTQRTGVEVRLPTEAEWEYACRGGGTVTPYYWGTGVAPRYCNVARVADGYAKAAPVGKFMPNHLGLYDMSGNVWEWCLDGKRRYSRSPQTDPRGPEGDSHVMRGGSWYPHGSARSAARRETGPVSSEVFGFRVCVVSPVRSSKMDRG